MAHRNWTKLTHLSFSSPKICPHKMQIGHQNSFFFLVTNKKNRPPSNLLQKKKKKKRGLSVASIHRRLVQRLHSWHLTWLTTLLRASLAIATTDRHRAYGLDHLDTFYWPDLKAQPGPSSGPTHCCCPKQNNVYKCGCQNL